MSNLNCRRVINSLIVTSLCFSAPALALDWRLGIGGHDYYVDEADSHTLGAGIKLALSHQTAQAILLTGELNIFVDHDTDQLDPDHIPVWFSSYYSASGDWLTLSQHSHLYWDINMGGKRNTVSSVEKQFKLFPALGYGYQRADFSASLQAGAGYYFLEIDDDVPRKRGYDREDFQNKTGAYTLAAKTAFSLSKQWQFGLAAQQWHDGSDWLENEIAASLSYDAQHWSPQSKLVFSVKYNEYNLAPYARGPIDDPDYLPILPWNEDLFIRIYFDMPWG